MLIKEDDQALHQGMHAEAAAAFFVLLSVNIL